MAYVYQAMRRQKDNHQAVDRMVFTEVYYGDEPYTHGQLVDRLKAKCQFFPGKWRIYRSVNRRNVRKAKAEYIKTLLDQMIDPDHAPIKKPESLWKSILSKPQNADERCFLLDIDSKDKLIYEQIVKRIDTFIIGAVPTPNGVHMVTHPFKISLLAEMPEVTIKKDALLFVADFEIK